jgi:hypothetical protein
VSSLRACWHSEFPCKGASLRGAKSGALCTRTELRCETKSGAMLATFALGTFHQLVSPPQVADTFSKAIRHLQGHIAHRKLPPLPRTFVGPQSYCRVLRGGMLL